MTLIEQAKEIYAARDEDGWLVARYKAAPDFARAVIAAEKLAAKYKELLEQHMLELHDQRDGVWVQSDFERIEEDYLHELTAFRAATEGEG